MNIQELTLDINKKSSQSLVGNVGETGSRFVRINLTDKRQPVDLTGITVTLYGQKPDGTKIFNDVTVEDTKKGVVTIELTSQLLAKNGTVKLVLSLGKGNSRLYTKEFLVNVDNSIVDDEAIVSTNEFTALTDALGRVNNIDSRLDAVDSQLEHIENKSKISITDFGGVGDNKTDNTNAFKELSDFLIDEQMKNGKVYEVVIPPGNYVLKDTFNIPRSTITAYGATLVFDCSNKSLLTFKTPHDAPWTYEVNIKGLSITTKEKDNYTNIGFDMRATSQLLMQDIYIYRCRVGILYEESSITSIIRPTIQNCSIAMFIGDIGNTLNIQNCDFWRNEVGFKIEGNVSSILVTDSYLEEQDIDILCEDVEKNTIIDNFVFDKVHIVKMNQLDKNDDTFVLKTTASLSNSINASFKFFNCLVILTPDRRNHYFAFNDSKNTNNCKVTICSEFNQVYYTKLQEGDTYLFKTINNSVQDFCVINNHFQKNNGVDLYSGYMWKNGIDTSGKYYSLVNSQLTFNQLPSSEVKKSLFYNHYTDRLIFKNSESVNNPIICGEPGSISKSYATDLEALKKDYNSLLDILKKLKIINII